MGDVRLLPLTDIRLDGGTQLRESMNLETIREYALAMASGEELPPVVVYDDGSDIWMADGFHRFYAYKESSEEYLLADVRNGTREDARFYAAGANARHGLPMTRGDKKKAVQAVLLDKGDRMEDADIAKHCGVSRSYVQKLRGTKPRLLDEIPVCDNRSLIEEEATETGLAGSEWRPSWPGAVIEEALETARQLPEEHQEVLLDLVSAPGVPPERGLEALKNLVEMSEPERERVVTLATSGDERDKSAAVSMTRGLPYVDKRWPLLETCRQDIEKCLRMYPADEAIEEIRIALAAVESALRSIENLERSRTDVAV